MEYLCFIHEERKCLWCCFVNKLYLCSTCQNLLKGKTSFLRRYFAGKFETNRKPTIGADFYSTTIPNPWFDDNDRIQGKEESGDDILDANTCNSDLNKTKKPKKKKRKKKRKISKQPRAQNTIEYNPFYSPPLSPSPQPRSKHRKNNLTLPAHIALQMWDTAGEERERFVSGSTGLTSRLGDSFFRFADAAILIYDATSSRSFLHLIKWYSELLERLRKVNSDNYDAYDDVDDYDNVDVDEGSNNKVKTNENMVHNVTSLSAQNFPVLVVGTKLDRLKVELSKQTRKKIVPQRDVLGLKGKSFNGQEYHYEYTVSNSNKGGGRNTGNTRDLETLRGVNVPLSYGLEKGRAWTSDEDYQDCLRVAEDECFPDRYMVLLWCKRNGLKHVEVSASDGVGVNMAVDTIVELTLKSMNEKITNQDSTNGRQSLKKEGGPIDFHERYGRDSDQCSCNCVFPWKQRNGDT